MNEPRNSSKETVILKATVPMGAQQIASIQESLKGLSDPLPIDLVLVPAEFEVVPTSNVDKLLPILERMCANQEATNAVMVQVSTAMTQILDFLVATSAEVEDRPALSTSLEG